MELFTPPSSVYNEVKRSKLPNGFTPNMMYRHTHTCLSDPSRYYSPESGLRKTRIPFFDPILVVYEEEWKTWESNTLQLRMYFDALKTKDGNLLFINSENDNYRLIVDKELCNKELLEWLDLNYYKLSDEDDDEIITLHKN
jgi:hypothetical protein